MFGMAKSPKQAIDDAQTVVDQALIDANSALDRITAEDQQKNEPDDVNVGTVANEVDQQFRRAENQLHSAEQELEEAAEDSTDRTGALKTEKAAKAIRNVRLQCRGVARVSQGIVEDVQRDGDVSGEFLEELELKAGSALEEL